MISIDKKKTCCGCGVCVAFCRRGALSLIRDGEGFLYPQCDKALCNDCNLCQSVCPFIKKGDSKLKSAKAYGAINLNKDIQINSASGGIFPLLATDVLNKGGFVVGAAFNDDWQVQHTIVDNFADLHKICRSKYVQSDASIIYKPVSDLLKNGARVLFSGTPCQCLALRNFLRKDYENLILVDIVCHGVPSPTVWRDYLHSLCASFGKSVIDIEDIFFKYKDGFKYHWRHPGFVVKWKDGASYDVYSNNTSYENGFLTNLFVRPSCHSCKVKSLSSGSDVSIGDFWGVESVSPAFKDVNGTSVIFLNSEKGKQVYDGIKSQIKFIDIEMKDIVYHNKRIVLSTPCSYKRNRFFKSFKGNNLDVVVEKLMKMSLLDKMIFKYDNIIDKIRLKKLIK